eukprot:10061011-Lingulodinium_polyedra.AAC.1
MHTYIHNISHSIIPYPILSYPNSILPFALGDIDNEKLDQADETHDIDDDDDIDNIDNNHHIDNIDNIDT